MKLNCLPLNVLLVVTSQYLLFQVFWFHYQLWSTGLLLSPFQFKTPGMISNHLLSFSPAKGCLVLGLVCLLGCKAEEYLQKSQKCIHFKRIISLQSITSSGHLKILWKFPITEMKAALPFKFSISPLITPDMNMYTIIDTAEINVALIGIASGEGALGSL